MMPASVALVHYHLRRGGVTRVMCEVGRILQAAGVRVVLVSGEAPDHHETDGLDVAVVPGLGYDPDARSQEAPALREKTEAIVRETLGGLPELWHLHNHSLGKNVAYGMLANEWALAGVPLVLQPHDFAEDGRPDNLRLLNDHCTDHLACLYPIGRRVRYAVLQERDRNILCRAGGRESEVQLLPNPVSRFGQVAMPIHTPPRRLLYVTRAIRRKNVGELLFWAVRHRGDMEFAVSLEPENPEALAILDGWRSLVREHSLPVTFGVGMDRSRSLKDVVADYDACITTSVAEGFGLSFLEPYEMNRSVLGRDLPAITAGFKADGIDLSHLYSEVPVPMEWLPPAFWPQAEATVSAARVAMGLAPLANRQLKGAWVTEGQIDFGRLDESAQAHVLNRMLRDAAGCRSLPTLPMPGSDVSGNRDAMASSYSAAKTWTRLSKLYQDVPDAGELRYLRAPAIRAAFTDPRTWTLLRM